MLFGLPAVECCESYYLIRGCEHRCKCEKNSGFCKQEVHFHPKEMKRQQTGTGPLLSSVPPGTHRGNLSPKDLVLPLSLSVRTLGVSLSTRGPGSSSAMGRRKGKLASFSDWIGRGNDQMNSEGIE